MITLAIDTSSNHINITLANQTTILAYKSKKTSDTAEELATIIKQVLLHAKINYDQINYLGIINGPDSFTSIRAALAFGLALSFNSKIQATSVSLIELISYRLPSFVQDYSKAYVVIESFRTNFAYLQAFDRNNEYLTEPNIYSYEQIREIAKKEKQNNSIIWSGNAVKNIFQIFSHSMQNHIILPSFTKKVRGFYLCKYTENKIKKGKKTTLEPLYINIS